MQYFQSEIFSKLDQKEKKVCVLAPQEQKEQNFLKAAVLLG